MEYPHPLINGKSVKFKYAVQISNFPLTIKIFSNFSKQIKNSYKNYLINKIIETFDIKDSKVNLIFSFSIFDRDYRTYEYVNTIFNRIKARCPTI